MFELLKNSSDTHSLEATVSRSRRNVERIATDAQLAYEFLTRQVREVTVGPSCANDASRRLTSTHSFVCAMCVQSPAPQRVEKTSAPQSGVSATTSDLGVTPEEDEFIQRYSITHDATAPLHALPHITPHRNTLSHQRRCHGATRH